MSDTKDYKVAHLTGEQPMRWVLSPFPDLKAGRQSQRKFTLSMQSCELDELTIEVLSQSP